MNVKSTKVLQDEVCSATEKMTKITNENQSLTRTFERKKIWSSMTSQRVFSSILLMK